MPQRWSLALLVLVLLAGLTPAQAQQSRANNNILTVDATDAPEDLLAPEEVERIARLQRDVFGIAPFSPVSPDDQMVLVSSEEQIGFLNIQDGTTRAINPEAFGPFAPLPLLGFSSFSWLDERTLGALAINFDARTADEAFVKLLINRDTLRLRAEPVRIPENTSIVSIAPNIDSFLIAQLPSENELSEEELLSVHVPIASAGPGSQRLARIAMPSALWRRVERARATPAFARIQLMQDEGDQESIEATTRSLELQLLSRVSGELRYITTLPEISALVGDAWTNDSSRLAVSFTSLVETPQDRPIFDGALISEELYRDVTGNLPPSVNPLIQNNNTYVIEVATAATRILRSSGPNPPLLGADDWSPDNKTLMVEAIYPARLKGRTHPIYTFQFSERAAYRFYDDTLTMVGSLESNLLSGGTAAQPVAEFVSPDEVIFRAVRGTERHPYYFNRVSGELRDLADRAGTYGAIVSTNRSRQLVFVHHSYTEPPEIYRLGWDGKGLARLTWFNEELRLFAGLRQEPVSFTLRNGQVRSGVLIQPADAPFPPRNRPIVVWQEGGPGVAMFNSWLTNVENPYALLPGMGISLLVTPLAGRPGYTPAVYNALADNANYGQIDIDEQAEIVRQMIQRGWTSRGKVGITGCSYGGYFTLQSLARHPGLYAAANPQCALVDTITEWTRGYQTLMPYLEGLPPYNNPAEYRRDSPAYNAGAIDTAVLTFHGTEDFLPIVQNENLHLQLVNRGLPARMVRFLGEGHGLSDAANQLYAAQEQISWFREYLGE
jgi:dipeptidyl aminopeptidase/acylaminoacyl peptidase